MSTRLTGGRRSARARRLVARDGVEPPSLTHSRASPVRRARLLPGQRYETPQRRRGRLDPGRATTPNALRGRHAPVEHGASANAGGLARKEFEPRPRSRSGCCCWNPTRRPCTSRSRRKPYTCGTRPEPHGQRARSRRVSVRHASGTSVAWWTRQRDRPSRAAPTGHPLQLRFIHES